MPADEGALGVLELSSVGRGILAADGMLKKAAVRIVTSRVICPGRYLVAVRGTVEDVRDSLQAGREIGGDAVVDQLILPHPHPSIFTAMVQATGVDAVEALGLVETYTTSSALAAADLAVKRAAISLLEVRLSVMLAGKSFVLFTGEQAAVETAVREASAAAQAEGLLVSAVVLPRPHPELIACLI